MKATARVGLMVVIFVALLFGAYTFLGQSLFSPPRDVYYVEMADAGGITPGTRLLLAGVKVGEVTKVILASPKAARLTVQIQRDAPLPEGSYAQMSSSLLSLGDTPLMIVAGNSNKRLIPGSTLIGKRSSPIDEMLPEVKVTMRELNNTLVATQSLVKEATSVVGDKGVINSVKKLMASADQTVTQFGVLARRLDGMVVQSQSGISSTLSSASLAMKDIRHTTQALAKVLGDGQLNEKTLALMDNLNEATKQAGQLVSDLRTTVNDPELKESLKKTSDNIAAMTETGTRIADDAEKIMKNGITISENTAELTKRANGLADDADAILKQLQKVLGKTPAAPKIKLETSLDLMRTDKPEYYRTDLNATLQFGTTPLHFGLYDAFESNKINLQTGKFFGPNAELRYGIFASKPGLGVDFALARGLMLRGDLYNINDPRGDIKLRYDLGSGFYGWAGVDQVLSRNRFLVGIGVRK